MLCTSTKLDSVPWRALLDFEVVTADWLPRILQICVEEIMTKAVGWSYLFRTVTMIVDTFDL